MIPKIIHYVWFGNPKKPEIVNKCINSWKSILPNYQIKEWNESNSPIEHPFVKYCLENKQWAYASDYVRLWALYNHGGIYLDTDMEVKKDFTLLLEGKSFFSAFEVPNLISAGLIAAKTRSNIIQEITKVYDHIIFPEPIPNIITKVFNTNPEWYNDDKILLGEQKLFYPNNEKVKDSTPYTIHHFEGSWVKSFRTFQLSYVRHIFKLNGKKYIYRETLRAAKETSKSINEPTKSVIFYQIKEFKKVYIYETHLKGPLFNRKSLLGTIKDLKCSYFKELTIYQQVGLIFKSIIKKDNEN